MEDQVIRERIETVVFVALALAALLLGGCGGESGTAPTPSPTTEQPTATATVPAEESPTPTPTVMASPTATPTATPTAREVPMFRGNLAHAGVNPGPGVEGSPTLLWRFETGDNVFSSPAVVDGVIYVGSFGGNVYALDAATGDERWRFETGDWVVSSPAVVDGVVYVGSLDSYVYALDAATGDERWR